MKLELKHLAPYLPYELKFQLSIMEKSIDTMSGIKQYLANVCIVAGATEYDIKSIRPIFHPLSDLTKEIEHNGEKFVPYDLLKKVVSKDYWIEICTLITENKDYQKVVDMPYWWVNECIRWHFDVFGLIEAGLAIDINSLNKKEAS